MPFASPSSMPSTALKPDPLMDELVQAVSRSASISPEQASQAVASMLRFFAARLPSPLFGELQVRLHPASAQQAIGPGPTPPGH